MTSRYRAAGAALRTIPRRQFLEVGGAAALAVAGWPTEVLAVDGTSPQLLPEVRRLTLQFMESVRVADGPYGRYRYAVSCQRPTLYSSTYAAMARDLYRDLESLTVMQRSEWIEYLQSHQDDDGLFRDPVIYNQGWYKNDPEWCGRRHLSCHVVTALTALGAVARKPLVCLEPFLKPDELRRWLTSRDWRKQPDFVGNEVLNVGTLLQYARDFQNNKRCGPAMQQLLEWLSTQHLNPQSGLWGDLNLAEPHGLSRAVMGAYHFWLLYFYDRVPIPHAERAIDMCLKTQNTAGGFGQGVHGGNPMLSSACEDIDSIDPLTRLMQQAPHRRDDIQAALQRGLPQVLNNQTPDGGFWFLRNKAFQYGHGELSSPATQGGMFPTWFRTLALAYIGKALPRTSVGEFDWKFSNCPGIQFWMPHQ